MRHWKYILTVAVCLLVFAGGWAFVSLSATAPAQNAGAARSDGPGISDGSGVLDGTTFSGQIFVDGEPLDVIDEWVFANGTFESTECSDRCNYPRAPYFTRRQGNAIEFVSESHCLDKDATIVWSGTIEDETISGEMTWTLSRWYWTIEREFAFEGTLTEPARSLAGG